MNDVKNETTINNVQVENSENTTTKTPSAKDRVMEDGKLTFWEIFYVARYFLPILTTIGWILVYIFQKVDSEILAGIILSIMGIGFISALTVSPIKLIMFIFKSIIRGFQICRSFIPVYGLADLFAATIGAGLGFMFGVIVVFGVPAVFTISKFFNEDSFE